MREAKDYLLPFFFGFAFVFAFVFAFFFAGIDLVF